MPVLSNPEPETWSLAGTSSLTGNVTVEDGVLRLSPTGVVTFAIGDTMWVFNETTGRLTPGTPVDDSHNSWIAGSFPGESNPAITGPDADANGDGVANALVFLLGGNPKDGGNRLLLPATAIATNPGDPVPDGATRI